MNTKLLSKIQEKIKQGLRYAYLAMIFLAPLFLIISIADNSQELAATIFSAIILPAICFLSVLVTILKFRERTLKNMPTRKEKQRSINDFTDENGKVNSNHFAAFKEEYQSGNMFTKIPLDLVLTVAPLVLTLFALIFECLFDVSETIHWTTPTILIIFGLIIFVEKLIKYKEFLDEKELPLMEFTFAGVALLLGMITAIIFIAFLSTKLNGCTLISFFALPSAYLEGVVFIRKIILETKEKDEDESEEE